MKHYLLHVSYTSAPTTKTQVLISTAVFSFLTGLGSASSAALTADVLPKDSDNAGRDMQLIQCTPELAPLIVIPLVVGHDWAMLGHNPYHLLFTVAAGVSCVALVVLFNIPQVRPTGR